MANYSFRSKYKQSKPAPVMGASGGTMSAQPFESGQSLFPNLMTSGGYDQYARQLGVSGSNPGRPLARRLNVGQGALALNQLGFRTGLEPQRQSAILRFLQNLSPGNRRSLADRNRAGIMENVGRGGNLLNSMLQGQGYGAGARMGAQAGLVGQGVSEANQYEQYLNSPEYEDMTMRGIINAIMGSTDQDLVRGTYEGQMGIQQSNMLKDQDQDLFGQVVGQGVGLAIGGGWNPFKKAPKKAG